MSPATAPLSASRRCPLRILVSDDDDIFRTAVRGLLQSLGHSVQVVTNGREAVELAAREDFDFVFLDIQTPEMGGYEAARSLRDAHQGRRRPRLIGLSGDQDEAQFYATAGMDAFLAKPVRLAELKHALVEDWPTRVDHQKGD